MVSATFVNTDSHNTSFMRGNMKWRLIYKSFLHFQSEWLPKVHFCISIDIHLGNSFKYLLGAWLKQQIHSHPTVSPSGAQGILVRYFRSLKSLLFFFTIFVLKIELTLNDSVNQVCEVACSVFA